MIRKIPVKSNNVIFYVWGDDGNWTVCSGCGHSIFWVKTEKGKNMPVCRDEKDDYISHFANCPKAGSFRKKEKVEDREKWELDGRVLCLKCNREFRLSEIHCQTLNGDRICPDCQRDLSDIF